MVLGVGRRRDRENRVNLRRFFTVGVGDQSLFALSVIVSNRVGGFGEQIDDRRTAQDESAGADREPSRRHGVEADEEIEAPFGRAAAIEILDIEKVKILPEDEISLDEPERRVSVGRLRQQILVLAEAHRRYRLPGKIEWRFLTVG